MSGLVEFWNKIKGSLFIIFLSSSFTILFFYFTAKFFFKPFFYSHINFFHDIFAIALAVLSPGVFAAILKYFQFLGVFETEINKIIGSSSFENTLQKTINQTVYSVDFLSKQKDLDIIWRNSTICLFKSYFSNISEKVESKLTNDLFQIENLSHYYKNYQLKIFVSLINFTHVKIEEFSCYTIVRPETNDFMFEFEYSIPKVEGDFLSEISIDHILINGKKVEESSKVENPQTEKITDIKFKYKLNGSIEYNVRQKVTLCYPIEVDNEFTYHCQRILEDLTAELHIDNNLNSIFVPMNNEKFDKTLINDAVVHTVRGVLLPNSGFRTYFFKK